MISARVLAALLLLLAGSAAARGGSDLPAYDPSDAAAPPVGAANLIASERFWPYQVALRSPRGAIPAGLAGVLIRVEPSGLARVDFGRDGILEVPVADTDLVERANRVRTGQLEKAAPNFVYAIAPRLADASSEEAAPLATSRTSAARAFLCVFADPDAGHFAPLVAALRPLRERAGLQTILFARGDHPERRLAERLRAERWPVAIVLNHLAELYERTLLPRRDAGPVLQLTSPEGRVLWERAGIPTAAEVRRALDAALATTTQRARR